MNRELEFRAWSEQDKKMYKVGRIDLTKSGVIVYRENYQGYSRSTIEEAELEQYAELKDKNGTKIFEGDVVTSDNFWDMKKTNNVNYIIIFSQYGFKMQDKTGMEFNLPLSIGLDVIGNIHENKDLLK